jgi:hypothetical protein
MLDGIGPFTGAVRFQHLEDAEITLYYTSTHDGDLSNLTTFQTVSLPSSGSVTLSAEQIGVPAPGSGVIATADR